MRTTLLRIATAGSVDDGKSTLIGRLLYDSKQVLEDQLAAVERSSKARGDTYVNLALLTDGLRAEREQGITIDVAYRYFATGRRRFIIADTPGHRTYTRNMVTGASTADVAIVLVDARQGVLEQSRRHAFIASLLGLSHLVVCVNKMDLVGFAERPFRAVEEELTAFASRLSVKDLTFIPISALLGDNVVERSTRMPWYVGPTLLYHLENLHVASDRNLVDFRFPVQWVVRPIDQAHHDYRGYAGQVASGVLRRGDEVVALPSMARSRVVRIDTFDGEVAEAFPPMSVTVVLADHLDVSRGDMLCRPNNVPTVAQDLEAMVCWMGAAPLSLGRSYIVRQTTRQVRARVEALRYQVNVNTLSRDEGATGLAMNEIGRVRLRLTVPLFCDPYRANRETGSFVLVDEATNDTVAAGMLLEAHLAPPAPVAASPADAAGPQAIPAPTRAMRERALGGRGATVLVTGGSAERRSTVGALIERRLVTAGRPGYLIDDEVLRGGICADLDLARPSAEVGRRVASAAQLLADAGAIAILATRAALEGETVRTFTEAAGAVFLEVHLDRTEGSGSAGSDATAEEVAVETPLEPERAADTLVDALRARGVLG